MNPLNAITDPATAVPHDDSAEIWRAVKIAFGVFLLFAAMCGAFLYIALSRGTP